MHTKDSINAHETGEEIIKLFHATKDLTRNFHPVYVSLVLQ